MGKAKPSFCSELLTMPGEDMTEQYETDIKDTANSMYSASMDTASILPCYYVRTNY